MHEPLSPNSKIKASKITPLPASDALKEKAADDDESSSSNSTISSISTKGGPVLENSPQPPEKRRSFRDFFIVRINSRFNLRWVVETEPLNSEVVIRLTSPCRLITSTIIGFFQNLLLKDSQWKKWKKEWLSSHPEEILNWRADPQFLNKIAIHSSSPDKSSDSLASINPDLTDEDILKRIILKVEAARLKHMATRTPMPESLIRYINLLGTFQLPTLTWLTEEETATVKKWTRFLREAKSSSSSLSNTLTTLVVQGTKTKFDSFKFDQWVLSTTNCEVFKSVGALISALLTPKVPNEICVFFDAFGSCLNAGLLQNPPLLDAIFTIVREAADFIQTVIPIHATVDSVDSTRTHIEILQTAASHLKLTKDEAIVKYAYKLDETNKLLATWTGQRCCRSRIITSSCAKVLNSLKEIRNDLTTGMMVFDRTCASTTLQGIYEHFGMAHMLRSSQKQLERDLRILLEEKDAVESAKLRLDAEALELKRHKTVVDIERTALVKEVKELRAEKNGYTTICKLQRDVHQFATSIRSAIVAKGDSNRIFTRSLFHGVIIYNVAKSELKKAISSITQIHDLSVRCGISFDPEVFHEFDWRHDMLRVTFRFPNDESVDTWNLRFNSDLTQLTGESMTRIAPIKLLGLHKDKMSLPPRFFGTG
ncbi:hypothetical protein HDU81_008088 [Chytriomyces hyalinus]|nr:hypothetical protein HDU81_008088 [Chytriomyces hyalinus]